MQVNPGELNKKIQIIQKVKAGTDPDGFPFPPKEVIVRNCWAKVGNTSGKELVKANSEFSEAKKRFLVRYTEKPIHTDMLVRYQGKDYNIEYINPYGENKDYLEIWTYLEERA